MEIYQKMKHLRNQDVHHQPKMFRAETPTISEVSSIVHVGHASKSPRINRVYLNRELPTIPDARESKISVLSLESGFQKGREDEEKAATESSKEKMDEIGHIWN